MPSLARASRELLQAADLYRHLALGYDTANHFTYNVEAARLLRQSGADPPNSRAPDLAVRWLMGFLPTVTLPG